MLPTPAGTEYGSSQNGINGKGGAFERPSAGTPSLGTAARKGLLPDELKRPAPLLPTPTATMADRGGRGDLLQVVRGNPSPSGHFKWPTPTARDHKDTGENTDYQRIADRSGLAGVVQVREKLWPTPVARDAGTYLNVKRGAGSQERGSEMIPPLAVAVSPDGPPPNGGQLNPTWVEWLMGFPLGWTVCEAWETRLSRRSRNGSGGK